MTYTETYTRGETGLRPYGPDGRGVVTLEAVEGGHRAKSDQAAPGVAAGPPRMDSRITVYLRGSQNIGWVG